MAAQGDAAALFDGRHDLQLAEAQVTALLLPQGRPVGAEDIRDLQGVARTCYSGRGGSSGLKTLRKVSVATWV
jgi:hypothetical protein